MRGDALLMRLAAPPVDDAANEALLRFVADAFEVSRSAVRLVSGQRARDKRVSIDGVTRAAAIARLSALIASAGAGR
jgi:uncharacterized protein YggU (UPF0235/DUF167 family)